MVPFPVKHPGSLSPSWWRCASGVVCLAALVSLAGGAVGPSHAAENAAEDPDEQFLREAGVGTEDASLLAYLKQRSEGEEDLPRVEQLIHDLGSERFEERDTASRKLTQLGPCVLPQLKRAASTEDAEVKRRVQGCLEQINAGWKWEVTPVVVRCLIHRRPAGTVEALLRYLPFEVDDATVEEIVYGLDALTVQAGKPTPALGAALSDRLPARRAAAACILGRAGDEAQRTTVRQLLADADPLVRLRAAQGLLAGGDREAIPALVALLAEPSIDIAWQAEELLHWVGGEDSPEATIGIGARSAREKCQRAWQTWWEGHAKQVDLGALKREIRRPGLFLVVGRGWGVGLCGCDGPVRWHTELPARAWVLQLLPTGRLLLREEREQRITERDLEGKIVWKYECDESPEGCQRLPNGNTFLMVRLMRVLEVTTEGQIVFQRDFLNPPSLVRGARHSQRIAGGRLCCLGKTAQDEPCILHSA